jgi:hypothetical protein
MRLKPPGGLLERLCSVGLLLSGKCLPGANNTGKSEKMRRVNALSTEVLDKGFFCPNRRRRLFQEHFCLAAWGSGN